MGSRAFTTWLKEPLHRHQRKIWLFQWGACLIGLSTLSMPNWQKDQVYLRKSLHQKEETDVKNRRKRNLPKVLKGTEKPRPFRECDIRKLLFAGLYKPVISQDCVHESACLLVVFCVASLPPVSLLCYTCLFACLLACLLAPSRALLACCVFPCFRSCLLDCLPHIAFPCFACVLACFLPQWVAFSEEQLHKNKKKTQMALRPGHTWSSQHKLFSCFPHRHGFFLNRTWSVATLCDLVHSWRSGASNRGTESHANSQD